ncbi:hypothetical protein GGR53DRAFT_526567 [Hypoxylon sp. FL1150]|nr:hypothetical protein GGR53DRAFT_526567 [Hypoxylon sp. FL1150]
MEYGDENWDNAIPGMSSPTLTAVPLTRHLGEWSSDPPFDWLLDEGTNLYPIVDSEGTSGSKDGGPAKVQDDSWVEPEEKGSLIDLPQITSEKDSDRDDEMGDVDDDDNPPLFTDPAEDEDAIELEFLLAVCPRRNKRSRGGGIKDPHPGDRRWQSKRLAGRVYHPAADESDSEDEEIVNEGGDELEERREVQQDNEWRLVNYSKRRINKLLRWHGVSAMEEKDTHLDGSESELSDEDLPNWDDVIADFAMSPPFKGMIGKSAKDGLSGQMATQFAKDHCKAYRAELWNFPIKGPRNKIPSLLAKVRDNLRAGGWPDRDCQSMAERFRSDLIDEKSIARVQRLGSLQSAMDPDHLPVVGLKDSYKAWRVVEDTSVDGAGMVPERYNIPAHREGEVPIAQYQWFGAEVVSPVYRAGSETTYNNIRKVCGILRNSLRIHKPMEVSTGFHVHLGHKHGWALLHLKKFITLWSLIEDTLIHVHRKDRGAPRMARWCGKMTERSKLACAIRDDNTGVKRNNYSMMRAMASPETKARYNALMSKYVLINSVDEQYQEFIREVWEFTKIDDLMDAMAGSTEYYGSSVGTAHNRLAARMRIEGDKKSERDYTMQTIEIRTMQGTCDAEHIIHWMKVLERIIYYTRRAGPREFSKLIQEVKGNSGNLKGMLSLLRVPAHTIGFFMDRTNREEDWFIYPDRDYVDWDQPFMVRGHEATHGVQYNFVPLDMSLYE